MLSNTSQMTIFPSRRQRTGALCVQHDPTAAALLTNTSFKWKMKFSCFPVLPGSAEAQGIWRGILKHLLIAYFIGNISTKNIKICSCVSNLWQAIGGTFFETRCMFIPIAEQWSCHLLIGSQDYRKKWPTHVHMAHSFSVIIQSIPNAFNT